MDTHRVQWADGAGNFRPYRPRHQRIGTRHQHACARRGARHVVGESEAWWADVASWWCVQCMFLCIKCRQAEAKSRRVAAAKSRRVAARTLRLPRPTTPAASPALTSIKTELFRALRLAVWLGTRRKDVRWWWRAVSNGGGGGGWLTWIAVVWTRWKVPWQAHLRARGSRACPARLRMCARTPHTPAMGHS